MHKPISSVYGEITRMLLTFPGLETIPNDVVLQRYKGIFKSLGNNIEYIILARDNVHSSILETAKNSNLDPDKNIKLINATRNYLGYVKKIMSRVQGNVFVCELDSAWHTIWAQDGYSCIKKEDGTTVLLEPKDFTRSGDHFIAEQVEAATDIETKTTKYHLEGGNILAGDKFILIGKDYLHLNQELTKESKAKITKEFKDLFGVDHVIWLGFDRKIKFPIDVFQGTYQPIFHIDMYITLAGKSDRGKELVFVADVREAKKILGHPAPPNAIVQAFDETADMLAQYNQGGLQFEVKRLPIDLWDNDIDDKKGVFLSYNNCLIEVFDNKKNVYLPEYSSVAPGSVNRRKLDNAVKNIFEENGFNVTLLEGAYEELAKRGGSIHCITKALDRKT